MTFTDFLRGLLYTIIVLAGMGIVGQIMIFLNKKIDELQTTTKLSQYAQLNKYIDSAQEAITTAVMTVSQTFVSTLKSKGEWTTETAIEAKDKAMNIAKSLMTEDVINAIKTVYNDSEAYIDSAIEAVVKQTK